MRPVLTAAAAVALFTAAITSTAGAAVAAPAADAGTPSSNAAGSALAGMSGRTTVQSFDWSTLNLTQKIAPQLPVVALSSGDAWLQVGRPGAAPELGGIDIDDYDGSLAKAAKAQGYDVISPAFASVTPQMIADAHQLGLPVVPWTVNTTEDMARLMDLGVDGIITDYPTRLRTLMDERGLKLPKAYAPAG